MKIEYTIVDGNCDQCVAEKTSTRKKDKKTGSILVSVGLLCLAIVSSVCIVSETVLPDPIGQMLPIELGLALFTLIAVLFAGGIMATILGMNYFCYCYSPASTIKNINGASVKNVVREIEDIYEIDLSESLDVHKLVGDYRGGSAQTISTVKDRSSGRVMPVTIRMNGIGAFRYNEPVTVDVVVSEIEEKPIEPKKCGSGSVQVTSV